jgi:hypothetical protein
MKTRIIGGVSVCLAVVFLSAMCQAQRLPITCTFSAAPPRGTTLKVVGGPPNAPIVVYGGFGTDLGVLVSAKGDMTDAAGNYTLFIPPANTVFRIELTVAGAVTHYRNIIRGNVNQAWPPGKAPPPRLETPSPSVEPSRSVPLDQSLQNLNGLPFDFSSSSFFTDDIGAIDNIILMNSSSQHYAFTSLTVYQNLNIAYFNQSEFDSSQAIATGVLFYQDVPVMGQDHSEYTNVAGFGLGVPTSCLCVPTGYPAGIGFVPQPFETNTYSLLVGNAAVLNLDGSIGTPIAFSYANTQ